MNGRLARKIRKELRQVNREVVREFYRSVAVQPLRRKIRIAVKIIFSGFDKRLKKHE